MDFSEKWGTSIENAVDLALIDLKLTRDQVEVIVLEEPSKGFFGIGSKLAKVRVQKKQEAVPEKIEATETRDKILDKKFSSYKEEKKPFKEERKSFKVEEKPAREERNPDRESKPAAKPFVKSESKNRNASDRPRRESSFEGLHQEKPDNLVAVSEDNKVLSFLQEITQQMGLEVSIEAKENEEMIFVDIEGKDSGTIIGKRGQTLDAIQYLTSLVANKGDAKYVKVVVDAENYRQKREKTLEQLANRLAMKVIKSRKSVRLEPMNPYERKVIHATLQNNPEVTTRSEGEEPYRRVIIDLK